ncbi:MAG: hypothetical protein ACP5E3_20305, partial [Bacteroidales bacterium]
FLSKDQTWDPEDKLIGYQRIEPDNILQAGESLEVEYSGVLPVVRPDDYYVLVKSDVFNYIPETDLFNNIATPPAPLFIDEIADLEDGIPVDSVFRNYSSEHYYQLQKPAGKGILLTLDASNTSPITDLFYRTGDIPVSGGAFDFRGDNPLQTDQRIIVPSADSLSEDFILAEADYLDGSYNNYTILAEQKDFSIVDIHPTRGG